jgi:hypothetical protein
VKYETLESESFFLNNNKQEGFRDMWYLTRSKHQISHFIRLTVTMHPSFVIHSTHSIIKQGKPGLHVTSKLLVCSCLGTYYFGKFGVKPFSRFMAWSRSDYELPDYQYSVPAGTNLIVQTAGFNGNIKLWLEVRRYLEAKKVKCSPPARTENSGIRSKVCLTSGRPEF